MKRLLIAAIILLLWASPAMAIELDELPTLNYEIGQVDIEPTKNNYWEWQDTAYIASLLIDWRQTQIIATEKTPEHWETGYFKDGTEYKTLIPERYKYKEYNPLLGKRPSLEKVNYYFAFSNISYIYLKHKSYQNGGKWLKAFSLYQKCLLAIELTCMNKNYQLGITKLF